ncbi:MAG TPA: HEAT repeat domain-containing protein [Pirellulaceae bacterium]
MGRSYALFALVLSFAAVLGCTRNPPTAHKEIQVPDGGPPVLTTAERNTAKINAAQINTAERAARETQKPRQPGLIAQAAYQQPIESSAQAIKPFEQWTDQDAAEDALGRIGAPAVPALMDALRSADPNVRKKAIEVLGRMGEDAAPTVPALTALLDDPDFGVRKAAARTLGQIGPGAKDAVPALMRNLFQQPPLQSPPGNEPPQQAVPASPQPE